MERKLLRPEEAAEQLGISRTRVYELLQGGQIESVLIGRSRRIPAEALTHFIDGLRAGTASASAN